MGRLKLTEELQIKLCAMIAVGCSVRNAARLVDVRESTVRKAAKANPGFATRLGNALAQREIVPLKNLQTAGVKYWRAAAWALERIDRNAYGRYKPDVVTSEQLAQTVEVLLKIVTRAVTQDDDRHAILRDLRRFTEELRTTGIVRPPRRLRPDGPTMETEL